MPYSQLTLSDREVIAQMTCRGDSPEAIAAAIGCDRGPVYRELGRNRSRGDYFPARAQGLAGSVLPNSYARTTSGWLSPMTCAWLVEAILNFAGVSMSK